MTFRLEDFLADHGLVLSYYGRTAPLAYHVAVKSLDDYRLLEADIDAFLVGTVAAEGVSTLSYGRARLNLAERLEGNLLILNPDAGLARKYETRVIQCPASLY